jgi:hypothetical protein
MRAPVEHGLRLREFILAERHDRRTATFAALPEARAHSVLSIYVMAKKVDRQSTARWSFRTPGSPVFGLLLDDARSVRPRG